MSLLDLEIGVEAKIQDINVDPIAKHRLNGFGIIPGSIIKTLRKGFGIKVYEVKGSFIALRNEDASKIIVEEK